MHTPDCLATGPDILIIKYTDYTTTIGLISSNDEDTYKSEVENVVRWSENNTLTLNTSGHHQHELVIDYSKMSPIFIL